jgi:hypothetical protein
MRRTRQGCSGRAEINYVTKVLVFTPTTQRNSNNKDGYVNLFLAKEIKAVDSKVGKRM